MERPPLVPCAAITAGTALTLYLSLRDGPVMWPHNALEPTAVAASLARGGGFFLPSGQPYAVGGPLYPLLLAPGAWAGATVVATVAAVNAAGWALGVAATFAVAREAAPRLAWLAALAVAVLASHTELLRLALPDGITASLSMAALALALRARDDPRLTAVAGVTAGLAALGRYVALGTVVPVCVAVVATPGPDRRLRAREAAVVAVLGASPILAWMVRNRALTGFATGIGRVQERMLARGHEWPDHAFGAASTAAIDLFSPDAMGVLPVVYHRPPDAFALGLAAVAAAIVAACVWATPPRSLAVRACAALVVLHVGGSVALWSVTNSDPLVSRYLSPAWAPLVVVLVGLAGAARGWRRMLALGVLAWIGTVNAAKSARLLGPEPPPALMQRERSHRWGPVWRTQIPWEPAQSDLSPGRRRGSYR